MEPVCAPLTTTSGCGQSSCRAARGMRDLRLEGLSQKSAFAAMPVLRIESEFSMTDKTQTTEEWCHGGRDGECIWRKCPQLRDDEPRATGRHCPLDVRDDDEY